MKTENTKMENEKIGKSKIQSASGGPKSKFVNW
jgi:hypothetical protein